MFCTNCGTELPDTANFCSNCGLQLKEGAQRQSTTRIQWEYCFITWEEVSPGKEGSLFSGGEPRSRRFWAKAIGPQGAYSAGESSTWHQANPVMTVKEVRVAFYELLTELLKGGWEPYWEYHSPDSSEFWEKAFKRPLGPER